MRDELVEWLESHQYDTWATWTFGKAWPEGPSRDSVHRHVSDWITRRCGPKAFYVVERGHSGGRRAHAHGLLTLPAQTEIDADGERQRMWRDWSRRYGRCSFDALLDTGGASRYVAKYALKERLYRLDWRITGDGTWH